MPFDLTTKLWTGRRDHFFRERLVMPIRQEGPHCVATAPAILTGAPAGHFLRLRKGGKLNTQDPFSWSEALKPFGMKLAYIPFNVRKLRFYMDELVALDDLFLLCHYSGRGMDVLRDPDERGWLCGSHVVVLHRDRVIDPASGGSVHAFEHPCNERHTKRLFRVVPPDHPRGFDPREAHPFWLEATGAHNRMPIGWKECTGCLSSGCHGLALRVWGQ